MARVIIEQVFATPMSDEDFAELSHRIDPCMHVRNGAWRRSYVSIDRLRMTCEYDAPDAESVREACRAAGVAFERIWTAQVFDAVDQPHTKALLAEIRARRKGGG